MLSLHHDPSTKNSFYSCVLLIVGNNFFKKIINAPNRKCIIEVFVTWCSTTEGTVQWVIDGHTYEPQECQENSLLSALHNIVLNELSVVIA